MKLFTQCHLHIVLSPSSTLNKIWQQFYGAVCKLTCLIPWDICLLLVCLWSIGPWHESWLTKNICWSDPSSPKIKKLLEAKLIFITMWDFLYYFWIVWKESWGNEVQDIALKPKKTCWIHHWKSWNTIHSLPYTYVALLLDR